jgi:WD40 repeat protein
MSGVPDDQALRASNWIEALHESIASHSPGGSLPADVSTIEEFVEIRDCLTLLERARRSQPQPATAPRRVGRFEIVREVGRGGFGVVFAAIDPRVGRQVALKVPRPEVLVDATARERFLREAKAAGGLAHPNLITIFEVGEDGPFCYITSAFCAGPNLAQWLKERADPVPMGQAVRLLRALSLGVAHAHARGVLHRDIKPSNVLLERPANDSGSEEPEPRLTDFGLAKLVELADDHTRSGALLGTPAYMAPEQAEGRSRDVGEATDVYALGVILFELLTGRPPLRGDSDVQTLQLVARGDVPPPTRFRPGIPRDLEAITLKCLEREPSRRYRTAQELADDLERFQNGQTTRARPSSAIEKLWKAARRRPAMAAIGGVAAVAILAMTAGSWWYSIQLRAAFAEVQAEKVKSDRHLYAASISVAHQAIRNNQAERARSHLAEWIPAPGARDKRTFAWHQLWSELNDDVLTLAGHTGNVYCVQYTRDGKRLATASQDRTARIWDAETGKCLLELTGHAADVNSVAFSPKGKVVATACDDGKVRVWWSHNGELFWTFDAHPGGAFGVAVSNTHLVVTSGADGTAKVWNFKTKELVTSLEGHADTVGAVALSWDSNTLATASDDGTVCIWNVAPDRLAKKQAPILHRLPHGGAANCVCFSHDNTLLLTSERSGRVVKLYDVKSGELIRETSRHYEWVHSIAFDPTDEHYAVSTKDGAVEQIDPADGRLIRRLPGHAARVWSVSFSRDGHRLATSSDDRTVKIWNTARRPEMVDVFDHVSAGCLTTDGSKLVVGTEFGAIHLVDLARRKILWSKDRAIPVVGDFNGDGQRDSGTYAGGQWRLKLAPAVDDQSSSQASERVIAFGKGAVRPVVGDWNGDGCDDLGVYDNSSNEFHLDFDLSGGKPEKVWLAGYRGLKPHVQVPIVGRWEDGECDGVGIATFASGIWTFCRTREDNTTWTTRVAGESQCVPLAGRWHAGRGDAWGLLKRDAGVWIDTFAAPPATPSTPPANADELRTPEFVALGSCAVDRTALDAAEDCCELGNVKSLAITPDGSRLAVGQFVSDRVYVWDVATGSQTGMVRCEAGEVRQASYSPDGQVLTLASRSGDLLFLDAKTLSQTGRVAAHGPTLNQFIYSGDGERLATVGTDAAVKIWDARGRLLQTLHDASPKGFNCVTFSPDDRLLAVGGEDRIVRIWDLETGRKVSSLAGHSQGVLAVSFSPDGQCLASAGDEGAIKLWDLNTNQELYALADKVQPVVGLAIVGGDLIAYGWMYDDRRGRTALQIWSSGQR